MTTIECKHGVILYGTKCINCEREKQKTDTEVLWTLNKKQEIFDLLVDGFKNPVLAAYSSLLNLGCKVDEPSFIRTGEQVGTVNRNEQGFIVQGIVDLTRLCEIGNFKIVVTDGVYYAER